MIYQNQLMEFFLVFTAIDRFIFRISDIDELDDIIPEELAARVSACHIYMICKRPRLSLKNTAPKVTGESVIVNLEYRLAGTLYSSDSQIPRSHFTEEEVDFRVSPYPHRELLSYDKSGKHLGTMLLANVAQLFIGLPAEVRDLKVLYVGKGVASKAKGRLQNHSTLQKILAQVTSNEPDDEVFILLYAFDRPEKSMFKLVSPGGEPEVSMEAVVNNISRMRAYKPNLDAQVAVIEAALINYFQTDKYNTHYIHGFPSPKLAILKDIYQADFAGLIVEIDNENIVYQRIYSDKVAPHHFHAAKVDFRKMENRFSILEFNLAKHVRST
jgi:hypothetical protein